MGSSAWEARVRYTEGLSESLRAAQEAELVADRYLWPWDDADEDEFEEGGPTARPGTLEELAQAKELEEFWEAGTHSVLDVDRVVSDGQEDTFGAIVPLQVAELKDLFGTERPTVADFDAVLAEGDLFGLVDGNWTGRAVVLHDAAGAPGEVYFWGWSGD